MGRGTGVDMPSCEVSCLSSGSQAVLSPVCCSCGIRANTSSGLLVLIHTAVFGVPRGSAVGSGLCSFSALTPQLLSRSLLTWWEGQGGSVVL